MGIKPGKNRVRTGERVTQCGWRRWVREYHQGLCGPDEELGFYRAMTWPVCYLVNPLAALCKTASKEVNMEE